LFRFHSKHDSIHRTTSNEIENDVIPEIINYISDCEQSIFLFTNVSDSPAIRLLHFLQELRYVWTKKGNVISARHSVFVLHINDYKNVCLDELKEPNNKSFVQVIDHININLTKIIVDTYLRNWTGTRTRLSIVPIWINSQETKRRKLNTIIDRVLREITVPMFSHHGLVVIEISIKERETILEYISPKGIGTINLNDNIVGNLIRQAWSNMNNTTATCNNLLYECHFYKEQKKKRKY